MLGYGIHIGSLFTGAIAYAYDICILSCSCYGLQKMLDICSAYGEKWDICFKSIDLTVAKRKYYGSFNNIRSVVGRQVNEIMVLHLIMPPPRGHYAVIGVRRPSVCLSVRLSV